jgi:hypothetical protein
MAEGHHFYDEEGHGAVDAFKQVLTCHQMLTYNNVLIWQQGYVRV